MLSSLLIILTVNSVHAQLNGEFWWLNHKLNIYRNVQPASPEFEDLSDNDTDETARVVFKDNDLFTNKLTKPISFHKLENQRGNDYTSGKIVWPNDANMKGYNDVTRENIKVMKPKDQKHNTEDEFVFNFPENEKYIINIVKNSTHAVPQAPTEKTENNLSSEILFSDDRLSGINKDKEAQSICTYIKARECYKNKGIIYKDWDQKEPGDQEIVCCVLPIQPIPNTKDFSSIHFPGAVNKKPRRKRSDDGSLNQRNFLLLHKFSSQHQKIPLVPTASSRIVTPSEEEYVDPYWNIKNSKFHTQNNHKIQTQNYDYDDDDYGDYASELPRPGLVGLYSDHAKSPSSWSFTSNSGFSYGGDTSDDYEDDDVEDDTFGYSTIDPRKVTENKKHKTKPMKLTTISDEVTVDAESHTINFHSNPDFQVLQGFKLLNLFRNRSRFHSKNSRTTTERVDDSKEFLGTKPDESSEVGDEFFEEDQLFGGCGNAVSIKTKDKEKQVGEAANGSHPWMVLVVLTKRRQNVLCYGTLIHPRAAITVADCVHGTSPRDVTVIAGAWDLNDRSRLKNRIASIQVHPKYKPGDDDNNLAVLYWMRALKLGTNIQPACLGEPHVGDDCRFFGWGSLDQGIQTRSKWQRASIRICDARGNKRTRQSEAFCATVSRGSVTSLGGPLICDIDGHSSVVGAVVGQNHGYVLMPVREFAMNAKQLISGD